MKLGFTGTRSNLEQEQVTSLMNVFLRLTDHVTEFHHGDCIGADALAVSITRDMTPWTIVAHPCTIEDKRAWTASDEFRPVLPPLDRNKNIVQETDLLLCTPRELNEVQRSGTWSTVRFATKMQRPIITVWSTGVVTVERLTDLQTTIVKEALRP